MTWDPKSEDPKTQGTLSILTLGLTEEWAAHQKWNWTKTGLICRLKRGIQQVLPVQILSGLSGPHSFLPGTGQDLFWNEDFLIYYKAKRSENFFRANFHTEGQKERRGQGNISRFLWLALGRKGPSFQDPPWERTIFSFDGFPGGRNGTRGKIARKGQKESLILRLFQWPSIQNAQYGKVPYLGVLFAEPQHGNSVTTMLLSFLAYQIQNFDNIFNHRSFISSDLLKTKNLIILRGHSKDKKISCLNNIVFSVIRLINSPSVLFM